MQKRRGKGGEGGESKSESESESEIESGRRKDRRIETQTVTETVFRFWGRYIIDRCRQIYSVGYRDETPRWRVRPI